VADVSFTAFLGVTFFALRVSMLVSLEEVLTFPLPMQVFGSVGRLEVPLDASGSVERLS
jgi:hypothetical protein